MTTGDFIEQIAMFRPSLEVCIHPAIRNSDGEIVVSYGIVSRATPILGVQLCGGKVAILYEEDVE